MLGIWGLPLSGDSGKSASEIFLISDQLPPPQPCGFRHLIEMQSLLLLPRSFPARPHGLCGEDRGVAGRVDRALDRRASLTHLRWFSLCLMMVWLWIPITNAGAASVEVSWRRNAESDLAGYEVRYGTTSGLHTNRLDAGLKTTQKISGLNPNQTYYFVVHAYNRAGLRSPPSAEIPYRLPPPPNREPEGWITSPAKSISIKAGQSVYFSANGMDPDQNSPLSYRWFFGTKSEIPSALTKVPGPVEFNIPGVHQVMMRVFDSKGLADPTPAVVTVNVLEPNFSLVPRTGWQVDYVTSQETGYEAALAIDGDPSTFWHTQWKAANLPPPPHRMQIDLGTLRKLNGFQYVPRQDNYKIGNIGSYLFFVSRDGVNWGAPVASGKFASGSQTKSVFFTPSIGRYVRLVSLTEVNGNSDASMAELNLLQVDPENRRPVAYGQSTTTSRNKPVKIDLRATDADNDPLFYQVVGAPSNGSVWKTGVSTFRYRPRLGFTGADQFTFRVYDGLVVSQVVRVRIQVTVPILVVVKPVLADSPKDALVPAVEAPSRPIVGKVTINGKKYLTLTVAKPAGADEVTPTVQVSPDLTKWFSGNKHTTVMSDNERFIKVRDNTPLVPGKKRHIRVKPVRR